MLPASNLMFKGIILLSSAVVKKSPNWEILLQVGKTSCFAPGITW